MVASGNHRFAHEELSSNEPFPIDDEALVAYLDGELTIDQVVTVEAELRASGELRSRLGHLKQAWEMLEELREEKPSPEFAQSTMEMIALSEERELESGRSRLVWLRRVGIMAVACLGLMVASYLAASQLQRANNRQSLNDLHILADWNAFSSIDSWEWLKKLETVENLELAWPPPVPEGRSPKASLGTGTVPLTPALREEWVAQLSDAEHGRLIANRLEFRQLEHQDRIKIRGIADQVYSSKDSAERYLRLARAYQRVLATITDDKINQLADAQSIEERVDHLTRFVNGKMVYVYESKLPDVDRKSLVAWLESMEEIYDSELRPLRGPPNPNPGPGARVMQDLNDKPFTAYSAIADEDLEALKRTLSTEAQTILSRLDDQEGEEGAIFQWLNAVAPRPGGPRRPAVTDLAAEYEKQSDEFQDSLNYRTPRDARRALGGWGGRGRRGGQGFGGPGFGGPGFGGPGFGGLPPKSVRGGDRPESQPPAKKQE